MFAARYFYPSLPSRSSNRKTMAVVIIIFHHCQHEDAQFHCSWWGGWIFDDTVCYIGSVNMRFPSLSQEIFHGSTACWIHMNIWWVWRVSCCIWKNKPKTPFITVMAEQCAGSLLRSWASLALTVWSVFTSTAQVLPWMCSGDTQLPCNLIWSCASTDCDSSLQQLYRSG